MILAGSTQSLELDLALAATTTNPIYVAQFYDDRPDGRGVARKTKHGATNGVTAVTACAAPDANEVRVIEYLSVHNADSAAIGLTIQINDGGTLRPLCVFTLAAGERVEYVRGSGFQCFAASGAKL